MNLYEPLLDWHAEFTEIRRDIHAHPELGFAEFRTADRVADNLARWGVDVHRGLAETGVVGIIQGRLPGTRAIGLRADLDALPMQEVNTFSHASRNPGRMHACGHDGHTTMLLAAARYLAQHRDFAGTVYVIFQPAEEGGGGARRMVEEGLFEMFPMDAVFGLHNWPGIPAGHFAVRPGPIMGSSNEFELKLTGRGGHAAMPHLTQDPVQAILGIGQSMQSVLSRNLDPTETAVVSITQVHGGEADNIIPDVAWLRGTVRTFTLEALDLIERRLRELGEHGAAAYDVTPTFEFWRNYPPTINHAAETAFATEVMREVAGPGQVEPNVTPSLGAEDFAYMLLARPGCYAWLGNGDGAHRGTGSGLGPCQLHNTSYDFNDELIPVGASYWIRLAQRWLAQPSA